MSHRVLALYHDRETAWIAAEDLLASGVEANRIVAGEGVSEGSGRVEVAARNFDQAIDVQAFLRQDGAFSADILLGTEVTIVTDTMPPVPLEP